MSFSNLKKQSSLGSLTAKLVSQVEKMNKGANGVDDRLWKPEVDKAGNGYAVIRFLPAPDGEDLPWAKLYTHAFQASGGWYIENSLTTLGQKDPVSEHNSQLWNSGVDSDKEVARKQKLMYFRCKISEDEDALLVAENMRESLRQMGMPRGATVEQMFDNLKGSIRKLRETLDN